MKKAKTLIGLILINLITGLMLYEFFTEALDFSTVYFILTLAVGLLWLITFIFLYVKTIYDEPKKMEHSLIKEFYNYIFILSASVIVYLTNTYLNVNAVIMASVLSLIGGLFLKDNAKEITIGAFLGMGSFLVSGYIGIVLASFLVYIVNFLIRDLFNGMGGKLGTTAFVGGLITYFLFNETFGSFVPYESINIIYVILIALFGSLLTYLLNNKLKLGPYISYSMVSLLGGVFLLIPATKDLGFINVLFAATFIGMSDKENMRNLFVVAIAALMFSLFSVFAGSFTGLGGRGGTMALISVLAASNLNCVFPKKELEKT